ncbi:MAG TPA: hypothetical protein VKB69_05130 [Micromonosporaceae bacterium]|nr:hypothetical protein [Micromonosporaceae bacterium]
MSVAVMAAALAACSSPGSRGGGGGGGDGGGGASPRPTPVGSTGPEVAHFAEDYARTCDDALGFPGAPAYTPGAGVHPAVILEKSGDTWTQDSPFPGDFPDGWVIGVTGDVGKAELVVCYQRTDATSSGRTCAMTDNNNQPVTVTLYDTTYRLRVVEARTGKVLYDKPGSVKSGDCPTVAYLGDDPTRYYSDAAPADYRGVLKHYITP